MQVESVRIDFAHLLGMPYQLPGLGIDRARALYSSSRAKSALLGLHNIYGRFFPLHAEKPVPKPPGVLPAVRLTSATVV